MVFPLVGFHDVFFLNPDIPAFSPRVPGIRFYLLSHILRLDKGSLRSSIIGKVHVLRCTATAPYQRSGIGLITIRSKSLFVHHITLWFPRPFIKKTDGFKLFNNIFACSWLMLKFFLLHPH